MNWIIIGLQYWLSLEVSSAKTTKYNLPNKVHKIIPYEIKLKSRYVHSRIFFIYKSCLQSFCHLVQGRGKVIWKMDVIHSWQKRLLHPGMMCLFCDYFYSISPRGLRTGCLVWYNVFYVFDALFFYSVVFLSVLTTFDDKMSNWPNVHT